MDLGLANRVAVVAAASKGLGRAVAERLAQEGARLAICARNEDPLQQAAQEIQERTNAEVLAVPADVSNREEVKRFITRAVERFGHLDVLVTNAGGPPPGNFLSLDDAQWQAAFRLTLMSAVWLCREVVPYMQRQKWGRIVHITSVSVKQPLDNLLLSNSLRLAVIGLSKSLANELAPHNITVNAVCPGSVLTERVKLLLQAEAEKRRVSLEEAKRSRLRQIPLGRFGQPQDLADVVAFLASENAGFITGTAIQVDGGLTRFVL
jgi:3-oxoacyl-[acyl-carrier protein] reductase